MWRETGVSAKVVRQYFRILEDTLLGFRLQPWRRATSRRLIETEKFYLFDVGVSNYLSPRQPAPMTPEFGKSFEHYLLMEFKAFQAYRNLDLMLHYWRTSTGQEVDFILGDMEVAIDVKSSRRVDESDTKSLRALAETHRVKRLILVSFETEPKILSNKVECLPWEHFLRLLWGGEII